ncbi:hypothetical protein AMECASPLE_011711 [Ameca splendens]|uniref:Uncharacterized protein n=1 Tax=Ameca splendens TaxID=208324 RepID=A0ABV0Y0Y8_9TELE
MNSDSMASVKGKRSISNKDEYRTTYYYPDQYTPVSLPAEVELVSHVNVKNKSTSKIRKLRKVRYVHAEWKWRASITDTEFKTELAAEYEVNVSWDGRRLCGRNVKEKNTEYDADQCSITMNMRDDGFDVEVRLETHWSEDGNYGYNMVMRNPDTTAAVRGEGDLERIEDTTLMVK